MTDTNSAQNETLAKQVQEYTISEFEKAIFNAPSCEYIDYDGKRANFDLLEEYDGEELDFSEIFDLKDYGKDFHLNLSNGDRVAVYDDENSINHEGAEIGVIFHVNNQFFRLGGEYSSHGAPEWDFRVTEVDREVKKVEKVFYTTKKK